MSRDVAAGGGGEKDNRDTDKNSERDSYVLPRRPGTFSEKFIRMWTEQPLIPLGAGATCYFLFNGLRGEPKLCGLMTFDSPLNLLCIS